MIICCAPQDAGTAVEFPIVDNVMGKEREPVKHGVKFQAPAEAVSNEVDPKREMPPHQPPHQDTAAPTSGTAVVKRRMSIAATHTDQSRYLSVFSGVNPNEVRNWIFEVERSGPLGLVVDVKTNYFTVACVKEGAIMRRNKDVPPSESLRLHDWIVEVNLQTDRKSMLFELQSAVSEFVRIKVVRSSPFIVSVPKNGPLGLGLFTVEDKATSLQIVEIKEGAILEYNRESDEMMQVHLMDLILGVSGVMGSAKNMMARLQEPLETVELTILRSPK